jgi:hypothetical protein
MKQDAYFPKKSGHSENVLCTLRQGKTGRGDVRRAAWSSRWNCAARQRQSEGALPATRPAARRTVPSVLTRKQKANKNLHRLVLRSLHKLRSPSAVSLAAGSGAPRFGPDCLGAGCYAWARYRARQTLDILHMTRGVLFTANTQFDPRHMAPIHTQFRAYFHSLRDV